MEIVESQLEDIIGGSYAEQAETISRIQVQYEIQIRDADETEKSSLR